MPTQQRAYNDAHHEPYECPGCGRPEESETDSDDTSSLALFCTACRRWL